MKICMLSRSMPIHSVGGMQDHILSLCQELINLNHEVTVISTRHPKGKTYENIDKIHVYYLDNTIPILESKSYRIESLKLLIDLQNRLGKFDIIHSQGYCGLHLLNYKKILSSPLIISLHGTYMDEIKTFRNEVFATLNPKITFNALLRLVYYSYLHFSWALPNTRKFNKIIVTSNEQKKLVENIYAVKDNNLKVVYNGIDTNLFSSGFTDSGLRIKLGISKEQKVILAVARLVFQKGIQYIILALPDIIKHNPSIKLVIVGDGKYGKNLKQLVKRLKIDDTVIFVGAVSPELLPMYYGLCDIFVNPTIRINGYDLSILQAMASTKPVVASNIGSVPTLITDGIDGLLVPLWNKKALVNQVQRVLQDEILANNIGKAAQKKVFDKFNSKSMALETVKIYEEAIADN